jgi:hypothetical protein
MHKLHGAWIVLLLQLLSWGCCTVVAQDSTTPAEESLGKKTKVQQRYTIFQK